MRAEPSTRTPYVGQQVVVDYVVYADPDEYNLTMRPQGYMTSSWDAPGFWRESMELDPRTAQPRVARVGGRTYEALAVKRFAAFPTRSGSLEIGAVDLEIEMLRAPLGYTFWTVEKKLTAPSVTFDVKPLPAGAPASFEGAVGQFRLDSNASPRRAEVGEAVEVIASVAGDGNLATMNAPTMKAPASVTVFGPDASDRFDRTGRRLDGQKTFVYTLVPQEPGSHTVPETPWTYFDPEAAQYRTLRIRPVPLEVEGSLAVRPEATAPAPGLVPMRTDRTLLPIQPPRAYWRGWIVGSALGLPLLALLLLAGARRVRDGRLADAPAYRRRAAARKALAALKTPPRTGYYVHLDRVLSTFLLERLDLPLQGFSRERLAEELSARGVSETTQAALYNLLDEADAALYAPQSSAPNPAEVNSRARSVVRILDEEAA